MGNYKDASMDCQVKCIHSAKEVPKKVIILYS
jgi:hypothetical protein